MSSSANEPSRVQRLTRGLRGVTQQRFFQLVILVAAILGLGFLLYSEGPGLLDQLRNRDRINYGWVAAALGTALISIAAPAMAQKVLLDSAGVYAGFGRNFSLVLAATAWSVTAPGGQIFSTTLTYRQTRRWGATRVVASWQLVMSGVLSLMALAVITVAALFLQGVFENTATLITALVALLALFLALWWISRNPKQVESFLQARLRWWNLKRGHAPDAGMTALRQLVGQLETVDLSKKNASLAFFWGLINWGTDVITLYLIVIAIGDHISAAQATLIFVGTKFAGLVQLTPGGVGQVEGALGFLLVSVGGLPLVPAGVVVILYRLITTLLFAAIGWIVFALMFRHTAADDPDDDPEEGTAGSGLGNGATAGTSPDAQGAPGTAASENPGAAAARVHPLAGPPPRHNAPGTTGPIPDPARLLYNLTQFDTSGPFPTPPDQDQAPKSAEES